jgi:hypothetical protein
MVSCLQNNIDALGEVKCVEIWFDTKLQLTAFIIKVGRKSAIIR